MSDTMPERTTQDFEARMPVRRSLEAWLLLGGVWLASLGFLMGVTIADPDLWGHTLYGMRAIEQGVPAERTDPFSYTATGAEWVNHEWLTEWQLGWLWKHAGNAGLVAWRNAWILVLWLAAAWALVRRDSRLGAELLLLVLTAECLADFVVFVRPQLATFGLFAVMLLLLRRFWDEPRNRSVWVLPILTAVWVNYHGGFLAGLGIQAAFVFAAMLGYREPLGRRRLALLSFVFLGSLVATGLNPFGWRMHAMLWQHLGTEQFVREWQPLWAARQSPAYYVPFLLMVLSLPGVRKKRLVDWIVLAIVSWQAVSHLRHVALLAVSVLILLPAALSESCERMFSRISEQWSQPGRRPTRIAGVVLIIGFLGFLHWRATRELREHGIGFGEIAVETRSQVPGMPINAIAFIRRQGLTGNLVTDYGWGQCVIWHLFPEIRVAFDGRYRTVYPADLEQEFLDWQRISPEVSRTAVLDDYPTELALLPVESTPDHYLKSRADWVEVYRDGQAAIFLNRHIPRFRNVIERSRRGRMTTPPVPRWVDFPGTSPIGTSVAIQQSKPF